MEIRKKLKTAGRLFKEKNWSAVGRQIKLRRRRRREAGNYRKWIEKNRITAAQREGMRARIAGFSRRPLISILLPVYDIEEKYLRRCIESVVDQIYENWELCIADDFSGAPHVRPVLEEYARRDQRIKVVFRAANGHISAASNSALEIAGGEFTGLLDHDDELSADALYCVAREIDRFPGAAFIYSDEDMIDTNGNRFSPKFKPDWSRDFFYSVNYVTHFAVYRTDLLRRVGGFRVGFEGSQDYDLALRCTERIDEARIRHIPKILYHWRVVAGSVAYSPNEKPYAHERARRALREHFERGGQAARVAGGVYEFHRVRYELPENPPRVSLLLSSGGNFEAARQAAERFIAETAYRNFEIVLICGGREEKRFLSENIKVIFRGARSAAAGLNRAVSQSTGDVLCFVDAGLRPLSEDWLEELASFAVQQEIGAVGGKILAPDQTINGGAFLVGFDEALGTANQGLPSGADEGLYRTRVVGNFSAVSARAMAVRRDVFAENGGFDAENFPASLYDADFCLRLRERGRRVVFTPYAELVELEKTGSRIVSDAAEKEFFRQKWRRAIERDPFYNPNLSLAGETFTIKI